MGIGKACAEHRPQTLPLDWVYVPSYRQQKESVQTVIHMFLQATIESWCRYSEVLRI